MKKRKLALKFTRNRKWKLFVLSFNNVSELMQQNDFFLKKKLSPNAIYEKVLNMENSYRDYSRNVISNGRDIIWKYWVIEYELLTDKRSVFGHDNQTTEKEIGFYVPITYVRGNITTVGDALNSDVISHNLKVDLIDQLHNLAFVGANTSSEDKLLKKIAVIPGELRKKPWFEEVENDFQVKTFPKERLSTLL